MDAQNALARRYGKWTRKANEAYASRRAKARKSHHGASAPSGSKLGKRNRSPLRSSDLWREQGMPKRSKSSRVSRSGGGRKVQRTRSRGSASAFRLKSRAGSRSRGRGLKRFGKRLGKRGGKRPSWFKAVTKMAPAVDMGGTYGNNIVLTKNAVGACTHWKNLSLIDLNNVMDYIEATQNTTGSTSRTNNDVKAYMADLTRRHTWRNAANYGETTLKFYTLTPRRDIPSYTGANNTFPSITPPTTNVYTTGGTLASPQLFFTGVQDADVIAAGVPQITNVGMPVDWTPYMSPPIASLFKIKPLKVTGPDGKSSMIKLQPGQECTYTGKAGKPRMVNFNKYGITSTGAANFALTWEALRETPIIFCVHIGSIGHDSADNSKVGTVPVFLDYLQQYRFKVWQVSSSKKKTAFLTTGIPSFAGNQEMVPIVTAVDAAVTET